MTTKLSSAEPSEVSRAAADAMTLIMAASIAQLIALGLNVLLRRELGAVGMAYIVVAQLALTYAPFVGLGVLHAAERELPIELARHRHDVVRAVERFAWVASLGGGLAFAAVILGITVPELGDRDPQWSAAMVVGAAVLLIQQVANVSTVKLRTRLRFRLLAILNAIQTLGSVAAVLIGAVVGGVAGALLATILASVAGSIMYAVAARPDLRFKGALDAGRRLGILAPGFLLSSLSFVALLTIDQIAVALLLGTSALGIYSAALLGKGFVLAFPTMVGAVIYPRLQRELGGGSDPSSVFRLSARTTTMVVLAMPVLVACFYVAIPLVIRAVLPEFADAAWPVRFLLVAAGGLAYGIPAVQFLLTINRQWLETAITATGLATLIVGYVALFGFETLTLGTVAALTALVYATHGLFVQLIAARMTAHSSRLVVLRWVALQLPMIALLLATYATSSGAIEVVAFSGTWLACCWVVLRMDGEARSDLVRLTEPLRDRRKG